MTEISRDSWSAWLALREKGGIEIEGRDSDLITALKQDLNPASTTFEEAVRSASTDALVRALFRRVAPFATMFADIVAYFKAAGAKTGRDHWRVKVDDEHLDLKDFEEFSATWRSIEGLVDLPALDYSGAWALLGVLRAHPSGDVLGFGHRGSDDPEIDGWYREYESGQLPPIPAALEPARLPTVLSQSASILGVIAQRLRDQVKDRRGMYDAYHSQGPDGARLFPTVQGNAYDIGTILQNETDLWTGSMLLALASWRAVDQPSLTKLDADLSNLTANLDRTQLPFRVSVADLERVLALPVWRTRHELYAVWIATRIVAALPGHDIELHHEDGKIVFAFKETVLATIKDLNPQVRLIGERRSQLASPTGKGRTAGVQPDFGIWIDALEGERCVLVVEVKHYRKAARRRFHEVLVDYAAGHPKARILLVNHGPVAEMLADVDDATAARCLQIGDLTPANKAQLQLFQEEIRDAIRGVEAAGSHAPLLEGAIALMVDISGSMRERLTDRMFQSFIDHRRDYDRVVLVDSDIRAYCEVADVVERARAWAGGGSTQLLPALRTMGKGRAAVVVVTDDEGAAQIRAVDDQFIVTQSQWGGLTVVVAQVTDKGPWSNRQYSRAIQEKLDGS